MKVLLNSRDSIAKTSMRLKTVNKVNVTYFCYRVRDFTELTLNLTLDLNTRAR